jgi:hypothetical protein
MDGKQFDSLIKRFTVTRMTRLEAVRGLIAGAGLAVTGTVLASDVIDAKHKGKKKKKGKKSKDNQQGTGPYNPPSPPPYSGGDNKGDNNKHDDGTTTSSPTCDKYEDCGYDAHWDDGYCGCVCDKSDKGYAYCDAKDSYDYRTCVSTDCSKYGDYYEYDPYSCSCQQQCQPPEYGCGEYGEWSYDTCSCECSGKKDYTEICGGKYADPYVSGTCVSTKCDDYQEWDSDYCACRDICDNVYECGDYGEWNYDKCACKCDEKNGYATCSGDYADKSAYGTCVYTNCDSYGYDYKYDPNYCSCRQQV